MTNFEVYKKTLSFSLLKFAVDLFTMVVVAGCMAAGFFIMNTTTDKALIGLVIGLIIGIILSVLISIFITNRIRAAQIIMMTYGVVDGKIPDNAFSQGFKELHGRFGKITVFFIIEHAIKGIFRQIGRGLDKLGRAVGGDVGESVTSAINSAIQILIGYMCDCCMGWILYRKDVNGFKAGCEGAVIFFKHGKTLLRNIGRIFGMGFISFLVIGGAFFGIFYLIFMNFPDLFNTLASEIKEIGIRNDIEIKEFLTEPTTLRLFLCAIGGIILWSSIHSVLIRPFILVGVLRNFMAAGLKDLPTESDFEELNNKSPKFQKLYNRI